jgi:poly(A) polymerase
MAVMKCYKDYLIKIFKKFEKEFKNSYVIGGFVRDFIINKGELKNCNQIDIDIIVENLNVDGFKKILKSFNLPFVVLDKKNRIYRTVLKTNEFLVNIDISSYSDFQEDIFRRDFTINTLCVKLENFLKYLSSSNKKFIIKNIIDYTKKGIPDIKRKILRLLREENIKEDPLRILRAARFMCYGFKIEKNTEKLCIESKKLLKNVAKERVNEELKKIFDLESYDVLKWLDKNEILEEIIPEIKILKIKGRNTQFKKFYFHPEGLWQHIKLTYKQIENVVRNLHKYYPKYFNNFKNEIKGKVYILKLCSLLHDIAKPDVAKYYKDKVRFFRHEIKSAETAYKILKNLKFSNYDIDVIYGVIKNHMRLGSLFNSYDVLTDRAYLRLFRETEKYLYFLLMFSLADRLSYEIIPIKERKKYFKNFKTLKTFIEFENNIVAKYIEYVKKSSLPRLVTGYDVMEIFNIPEGPLVGKVLKLVEEAQLLGKICNKTEALKLIRKYLRNLKNEFVEN